MTNSIFRDWIKTQFQDFHNYTKDLNATKEKKEILANIFKSELSHGSLGANGLFTFNAPFYDIENKRLMWVSRDRAGQNGAKFGANYFDMSDPLNPTYVGFTTFGLDNVGIIGDYNLRSITKFGDYLYIIARSKQANIPSDGMDNSSIWGALVCANASDLSVVWTKTFNAKGDDVKIYKATNGTIYMACGFQMSYIKFFTINPNDYTDITLRDTHYTKQFKNVTGWENGYEDNVGEHQYGNFVEHDGHVLYISCGFSDGVHIYDVTNIVTESAVLYNYELPLVNNKPVHTFDCAIDYPYVYCTIAPNNPNKIAIEGVSGVLTLDISDLSNLQATYSTIPAEDICERGGGDWKPTTIAKHDNLLFLNNGEKGVATFMIVDHIPQYLGCYHINDFTVGELTITEQGILIIGESPEGMTHPNGSAPTEEGSRLWRKDKQTFLLDVTGGIGSAKLLFKTLRNL